MVVEMMLAATSRSSYSLYTFCIVFCFYRSISRVVYYWKTKTESSSSRSLPKNIIIILSPYLATMSFYNILGDKQA
jgi:hypothetical protein